MILKLRKFNGGRIPLEDFMSASAFVYMLESQFKEQDILKCFKEHLQGLALTWFLNHENEFQDCWSVVRAQFLDRFLVELTVRQKVTIRQSLKQCFLADDESVQEFLQRCILAQFAIDDETEAPSPHFQRHVLLNFLLGLRSEIQSKVITSSDDLRTLQVAFCQFVKRTFLYTLFAGLC